MRDAATVTDGVHVTFEACGNFIEHGSGRPIVCARRKGHEFHDPADGPHCRANYTSEDVRAELRAWLGVSG